MRNMIQTLTRSVMLWPCILVVLFVCTGCYLEVPLPRTNPLDPNYTGAPACQSDTDCSQGLTCQNQQCLIPTCVPSQFVGAVDNNNFSNTSDGTVNDVLFHPSKSILASGSGNGTIKLWKVPDLKLERILTGHTAAVTTLAFNPDGSFLASGSEDNTIRIWNVTSGKEIARLAGHTAAITSIHFHATRLLISSSFDKTIRFWSVDTPTQERRPTTTLQSAVLSVRINPQKNKLAAGMQSGQVILWDGEADKQIVPDTGAGQGISHVTAVYDLAWSPDGKRLVTAPDDGSITVWDVNTLKADVQMKVNDPNGHKGHPWSIDLSPSGLHAASAGSAGRIVIWNTQTGELIRALDDLAQGDMSNAVYHPNGTMLAGAAARPAIGLWKCP